jgi:hypothetical protein
MHGTDTCGLPTWLRTAQRSFSDQGLMEQNHLHRDLQAPYHCLGSPRVVLRKLDVFQAQLVVCPAAQADAYNFCGHDDPRLMSKSAHATCAGRTFPSGALLLLLLSGPR